MPSKLEIVDGVLVATVNSLGRARDSDTGRPQRHHSRECQVPSAQQEQHSRPNTLHWRQAQVPALSRQDKLPVSQIKEPHVPAQQPLMTSPCSLPTKHKHIWGRHCLPRGLQLSRAPSVSTHSLHTRESLSEQQHSQGVSLMGVVVWAGSLTQQERFVPFWGPGCPKSRSVPCTSHPECPRRTSHSRPRTGCHLQG